MARPGSYQLEVSDGMVEWSDEVIRIFEWDPAKRKTTIQEFMHEVHPDDQQPLKQTVARAISEGQPFNFEHRIVTPQGATKFLQTHGQPVVDEKGKVVRIFGTLLDITELRVAEAASRESEEKFRRFFNYAPVAIVYLEPGFGDFDGSFLDQQVEFNGKFAEMLGYQQEELRSLGLSGISHPEDFRKDITLTRELFEGQRNVYRYKKRFYCKDGSLVLGDFTVILVRDAAGRPQFMLGMVFDVTGSGQIDEGKRRNAARVEKLAKLSQAFFESGLDYPVILNTVAQNVAELFGDACVIRLFSEDKQWLDLGAYHHPKPQTKALMQKMLESSHQSTSNGLYARVLETGAPLHLQDVKPEQVYSAVNLEYRAQLNQLSIASFILVPLRAQRGLIGTLSITRDQPGAPHTQEDVTLLQDVASRAAFVIENARLYVAEAQRLRELNALYTATSTLLTTLDLDTLLGQILDAAMVAIPAAEKGLLNLVAPETGKLEIRAMFGYTDPRIQTYTRREIQGYIARVAQEKKPLLIHDLQSDPTFAVGKASDEAPLDQSAIVAPLIFKNEVLGVLSLNSSRQAAFTEADLKLLVSFAATTSAAIKNALLHGEVQWLAITDELTNLYNRRGFYELGRREIERSRRFGHPLSAIMLDIDLFKNVNDTYGHHIGDQVLRGLAERLSHNLREFDIVGRYGGEEFAILLPETDLFTACGVAERLRKNIAENPIDTERGPIAVTVSLGVVKATAATPRLDALLKQADRAMYVAKQTGRDRVEVL